MKETHIVHAVREEDIVHLYCDDGYVYHFPKSYIASDIVLLPRNISIIIKEYKVVMWKSSALEYRTNGEVKRMQLAPIYLLKVHANKGSFPIYRDVYSKEELMEMVL